MLSLLAASLLAAAPAPARIHVDSGYIDVGSNVRIFARVLGGAHKDTLVFVHGGPGLSSAYLVRDLDDLAGRYTIVLYDQRGSGKSTLLSDSTQVSLALHMKDLESVLNTFHIVSANLYGHSWGAGLVANFAAAKPGRVKHAILGSAIPPRRVPYMAQFSTKLTAWADSSTRLRLAQLAAARETAEDPVAACQAYWKIFIRGYYADTTRIRSMRSDMCSDPPKSLNNHVNQWTLLPLGEWDWRPLLTNTRVPVLVLQGSGDPVPMESAKEWASSIAGAKLVVIDGCGHFPMVERPRELGAAIDAFLR